MPFTLAAPERRLAALSSSRPRRRGLPGTFGRVSTGFVVLLALAISIVVASRLSLRGLPLRDRAVTLTVAELALTLCGLAILTFHCGAMFFTAATQWIPGTDGAIEDIRALGTSSLVWYVLPALLVLLGLRRLPLLALIVVSVALLAIGVTMYDGGSLETHLVAIFAGVVSLTAVAAMLVRPPRRDSSPVVTAVRT